MNAHDTDVLVAQVEILALIALLVRPDARLVFGKPMVRFGKPLIRCAAQGCRIDFYHVPARGERAPFCLDHADDMFGRQS